MKNHISIIIPTYKPGAYIYKCLDSLLSQTLAFNKFEIIIILNGCKEPYEVELKKYIKEVLIELNVKFIQTDSPGVSNARNIGIENSHGQYICFIDDDDYVSSTYLKEMLDIASQGYTPLSNLIAFKDGTNEVVPKKISTIFENSHRDRKTTISRVLYYFSVVYCKVIKKEEIGDVRFDLRFANGEDSLFMFIISNKFNKVMFTSSEAIYYRRIRNNSATNKKRNIGGAINNHFKLFNERNKAWIKKPFDYNFLFYITRPLSSIKGIMQEIIK